MLRSQDPQHVQSSLEKLAVDRIHFLLRINRQRPYAGGYFLGVKLGDDVRTMLSDFESAIQKEPCKTTAPGGGVHLITRYVLNYISLLADYSSVLIDIIADYPLSPFPEYFYRSLIHEDSTSLSLMFRSLGTSSMGGYIYFFTVIEDKSKFI
ncbi:hypothetical protein HN51_071304 [Arachis hypogaea]|nr:exocyst complex component EXO70H1-like [Arachis hypogaea]QHO13898.1 uncharacterized protein DS421_15g519470 [Arachis hypogaea]